MTPSGIEPATFWLVAQLAEALQDGGRGYEQKRFRNKHRARQSVSKASRRSEEQKVYKILGRISVL